MTDRLQPLWRMPFDRVLHEYDRSQEECREHGVHWSESRWLAAREFWRDAANLILYHALYGHMPPQPPLVPDSHPTQDYPVVKINAQRAA